MSSPSSLPDTIELVQARLLLYYPIFLLIFGNFGNVLNICIFLRPKLRSFSFSWYFLAATCSNFIALYMGCLTRVLISFGYNPDTQQALAIYCKTRTYFTYSNLSLSIWLQIGACADRWASTCTNPHIRSFSRVKIAQRVIAGITLFIYLVYGQMFYCFNSIYDSASSNCYPQSNTCDIYNQYALFLTYSALPCSLMLVFGLLTIRNMRKARSRIVPLRTTLHHQHTAKKIKQMTIMLLVEVICSILLSLPVSLQKVYYVITVNRTKSAGQQEIEYFVDTVVVLITLTNSAVSFYIFACTGHLFRKELKRILFAKCVTPVNPREQQTMGRSIIEIRKKTSRHLVQ